MKTVRKLNPIKIIGWTTGMALGGYLWGGKALYGTLVDTHKFVAGTAVIGLVLGVAFSLVDYRKAKGHERPN